MSTDGNGKSLAFLLIEFLYQDGLFYVDDWPS